MKFGEIPVGEAAGAILAHSLRFGATAFKKGRVLSASDVAALEAAGVSEIVAARLDAGDLREDEAADRIAAVVAGPNITASPAFTGRANLYAEARGLLVFDRDRLDRLNLVDEAVTLGTLPPFAIVEPRQMVATVKIIPFAVSEAAVARAAAFAAEGGELLRVAAFAPLRVALIQTRLPGLKESILDKTRAVTETRLAALGSALESEERCEHTVAELAPAIALAVDSGAELVLVHGASVIVDRRDVIPAAVEQAGGRIEHFGMPVDPGNMLLLGKLGDAPVLGLPGCARSPKVNGFDWMLERLCAGVPVGREDIMRMGAGGLLAEIPSRPLPRAEASPQPVAPKVEKVPPGPRIAALLLAAGRSTRMGGPNKLLEPIDGTPMVARTAQRLLSSRARPIVAVLGNQAEADRPGARQIAGPARAQPGFHRRIVHIAEMRAGRAAERYRRRRRLPRRHAADHWARHRPADRLFQPVGRTRDYRPDPSRQARQPGIVGETLLRRDGGAGRRCRRQAPDRGACRAGLRGRDGY